MLQPIKGHKPVESFNNFKPVESEKDRRFGLFREAYFDIKFGACKNTIDIAQSYPTICVRPKILSKPSLFFAERDGNKHFDILRILFIALVIIAFIFLITKIIEKQALSKCRQCLTSANISNNTN